MGPPAVVVFLNGPLRQTVGLCSSALSLETRDIAGNASPVAADTLLDLAAAPLTRLAFYSDAACTIAASTVTVPAATSTASFWFKAIAVGNATVTVSDLIGRVAPGTSAGDRDRRAHCVLITSNSQVLRAGQCSAPLTLEAQDAAATPTNVLAATPVTLSGTAGITFYSNSNCSTALPSATIAQGTSSATLYFKGITGGAGSVTVTASFGSDTQGEVIVPAVQTGSCTLAATVDATTCPIPYPLSSLSSSFLVFQAATAPGDTAPSRTFVRCRFGSTSTILCSRRSTAGGLAHIEWQTADLPGATVQHLPDVATTGTTTNTLINLVPLANTFVLHSMESTNLVADGCDFFTARLSSTTNAELKTTVTGAGACSAVATHSLQVVTIPGLSVSRGTAGNLTNNVMSVTDTPTAGEGGAVTMANTALLYSWRMLPSASSDLCRRMLRGRLVSDTTLTFSRSDPTGGGPACNGDTIDDVQWERLEFPTPVQQLTFSMANGVGTASPAPTVVDTTRTLVFSGGQVASGQVAGEGSLLGSMTWGAMFASLRLTSPTTVAAARDVTAGAGQARWTSFVVQLTP